MPRFSQLFAYLLLLLGMLHFTLTGRNKKSRGLASVAGSLYFLSSGKDVTQPDDFLPKNDAFSSPHAPQGYLAPQQARHALPALPFRQGPRPDTAKEICHWQRSQLPDYEFSMALQYELFGPTSALRRTPGVSTGPSLWEVEPSWAFFYTASDEKKPQEFAVLQHLERPAMRDICSWHLVLHPRDARTAVEKGWAEFYPLAGFAGSEPGFVMLYGPRDLQEVQVLQRLLFAALEYAKERDAIAPVIPNLVKPPPKLNFETSSSSSSSSTSSTSTT